MWTRKTNSAPAFTAQGRSTDGLRIYAIGDVHGRLDLLEPLLRSIRADCVRTQRRSKPVLIFVGDYIDRGDASNGVIDRIIALRGEGKYELRTLRGNHEEALLNFLRDPQAGPDWFRHGGGDTMAAYGVSPPVGPDPAQWRKAQEHLLSALPASHLEFLQDLEMKAIYGDYVFVHAGLRPGVALASQTDEDLLWIRGDFLNSPGPFEKIVVHGHTPERSAFMGAQRIGIDTGAYASGILTAVRLENSDRRFIQFPQPVERDPFADPAATNRPFSVQVERFKENWLHGPRP